MSRSAEKPFLLYTGKKTGKPLTSVNIRLAFVLLKLSFTFYSGTVPRFFFVLVYLSNGFAAFLVPQKYCLCCRVIASYDLFGEYCGTSEEQRVMDYPKPDSCSSNGKRSFCLRSGRY